MCRLCIHAAAHVPDVPGGCMGLAMRYKCLEAGGQHRVPAADQRSREGAGHQQQPEQQPLTQQHRHATQTL